METASADNLPDKDLLAAATAASAAPAGAAAPGPAGADPATPAAPIDWKQEARDLWKIIAMLSIRFPSLEKVYTDQAIEHLATAWAPVLERHNLDLGKLMIYFAAATATLPVLGDTYKAIKHDRAIERASASAAAPGPAAAPAAAAAASSAGIPDPNALHRQA